MVKICSLLLLATLFSCSGSLRNPAVEQSKPKISSTLSEKINGTAVGINSEDRKFRVGVLYKKTAERTKKLIDVDFAELSSSDILLLSQNDDVQFIEEDYKVTVNLIYASKQIGARDVWAQGYKGQLLGGTSQPIRIAVVDTGLDEDHLDFSGAGKVAGTANCYNVSTCVPNNQYDDHGHGTHVAGIVLGGGNSCTGTLNDDFYLETDGSYISVNQGSIYYFPTQFLNNPSVGGTLKADVTWDGANGTNARAGFMTEAESIKENPTFLVDPAEEQALTDTGPGVTGGKFGNYTEYSITPQNSHLVPFAFSTYTQQSSVTGSKYWARIKSTAQGWGDIFPRTAGISYMSQVVGVKALGSDGSGNVSDIVRALNYVGEIAESKNIIAVNLSFSLGGGITSEIINASVAELVNMGVNVVVSAGNDQQSGGVVSSPGDSSYAITVGAVNENNEITNYSSVGAVNGNPLKPDVVAPGGSVKGLNGESYQRLGIVSAKTTYNNSWWNTINGMTVDPYTLKVGTSQASPMVAGLVGLMASKRLGAWDFTSSELPKLFKMIVCMSAFETGAREEATPFVNAPITPERAGGLKDRVEGYGRICAQGAISAFDAPWDIASSTTSTAFTFGNEKWDQKTFIREVSLSGSKEYTFSMAVPSGSDYDLYLFRATPDANGEPVLVASSALLNNSDRLGPERIVDFIPSADGNYYIVSKWISGSGNSNFVLESSRSKPTTPTTISNLRVNRNMRDKTIDVSWKTNVPAVSVIQYGLTGGLESSKSDDNYKIEHSFSFPLEYENYYYLRVLSSSSGTSENDISTATSSVFRASAVTELVKDITVEDLPVVDSGGCGSIKPVGGNGNSGGSGNLIMVLIPIVVLFGLKIRRKSSDKSLQLP